MENEYISVLVHIYYYIFAYTYINLRSRTQKSLLCAYIHTYIHILDLAGSTYSTWKPQSTGTLSLACSSNTCAVCSVPPYIHTYYSGLTRDLQTNHARHHDLIHLYMYVQYYYGNGC